MARHVTWTGLALLGIAAAALGQNTGPGAAGALRSVADVLQGGADEAPVEIEGLIVRKVAEEKYMFSDGAQEILVEIDDEVFPKTGVDDKTKVRIRGEVDRDHQQTPEIDVETVALL